MGQDVDKKAMTKIATDESKALFFKETSELKGYFADLEDAVCNVSPPPPPPSPPPPCVDIGREGYPGGDEAFCANTDQGENGGVGDGRTEGVEVQVGTLGKQVPGVLREVR